MNEVQTVERMPLVLDAAEHMRTASLAGMPLYSCRCIDHLKLVAVFQNADVFARYDRYHSKDRPLRLPAFGAAAGVVVGDVTLDADLDRPILAFADQGSAGETARALPYSVVNRWVDMNCHGPILLFDVFEFRTRRLNGSIYLGASDQI